MKLNLTPPLAPPLGIAPLLLALGAACVLEMLFTIEWSYPYCSNPDSGPAYTVTGMSLPYTVFGGVSSLEYIFMPHVYALNLLLLTVLLYPFCAWIAARTEVRARGLRVAGVLCMSFVGALRALGLYLGADIPVGTIADGGHMRYEALRPVSFGFALSGMDRCKSSSFWFPKG